MFEPQPSPFAQSQFTRPSYGVTIANAGIPEYAFSPTPLGQGQLFLNVAANGGCNSGGGGGLGVAAVSSAGPASSTTVATAAAALFTSPALLNPQVATNNNNHKNSTTAGGNSPHNNSHHHHLLHSHQQTPLPPDGHSNHQLHHRQHHRNSPPHIAKAHYQDIRSQQYHSPHQPQPQPQHQHQHPNLNTPQQRHQHQSRQQLHRRLPQHHVKMEPSPTSDIAQQQAAAREYKPDLEGPLVGEKTPSHAISQEYAKADPTYVAKTLALPQTYSHFRPIQGDGNCGWRAIGFAYFETLIRCGDITQIQGELSRLRDLNTFIENVGGFDSWMLEDMVNETYELLQEIIVAISSGQDSMGLLMTKFNDVTTSQYIIYHLRCLAASWLRGNSAEFQPYLAVDIESYVQGTIMPVDQEIDAMCIRLLVDVFLKPANMVLEIAYLDRSDGAEVNVHRMPEEANGQSPAALGPIIYLLYRPGHYDILYRDAVLQPTPPAPTAPISLQVNRATFTHQADIQSTVPLQNFSTLDMNALSMIPAFEPAGLSPLVPPPTSSPMSAAYAPSPQSPWMAQPFADPLQAAAPPPIPPQPSPPQQAPTTPMTTHPLRFSKWNFPDLPEMAENAASYEPAFTTNTFKNSHFNVAHYSNNNFQPEMYRPEAEEAAAGRSGGRKKSTEHAGVKKDSRG